MELALWCVFAALCALTLIGAWFGVLLYLLVTRLANRTVDLCHRQSEQLFALRMPHDDRAIERALSGGYSPSDAWPPPAPWDAEEHTVGGG